MATIFQIINCQTKRTAMVVNCSNFRPSKTPEMIFLRQTRVKVRLYRPKAARNLHAYAGAFACKSTRNL